MTIGTMIGMTTMMMTIREHTSLNSLTFFSQNTWQIRFIFVTLQYKRLCWLQSFALRSAFCCKAFFSATECGTNNKPKLMAKEPKLLSHEAKALSHKPKLLSRFLSECNVLSFTSATYLPLWVQADNVCEYNKKGTHPSCHYLFSKKETKLDVVKRSICTNH